MSTISEKIRSARRAKNLTQQELGEMLGVNKAAICKYEKGLVKPPYLALAKLEEVLKINLLDENAHFEPSPDFENLALNLGVAVAALDRISKIIEKIKKPCGTSAEPIQKELL